MMTIWLRGRSESGTLSTVGGVLDSDETPGGCWAHFSVLDMAGYRSAVPGARVTFSFEQREQDGYGFRAVGVQVEGAAAAEPVEGDGAGYSSHLTINTRDQ